jgi:asparagine synthase (glutamine-hydrolysing)
MSALCGLVRLDGAPVDPADVRAMAAALRHWGADGGGTWIDGTAGVVQLVAHRTPDAVHERGPLVRADGTVVTAAARLDNRDDLLARFRLPDATTPDAELVARAYELWQEDAPLHLFGDWAFAAWHPRDRRLFLARDHYGNTAMHYYADGRIFAFASGLHGVLALKEVPRRLNELRLSHLLTVWTIDGRATIYEDVFRLPAACTVTVRDGAVRVRQYWQLDDAPEVKLASDDEYVERFLELFTDAVRVRLRSTQPIAAQLSSGLDSGGVTAIAARLLARRGDRLTAFTSTPMFERETENEIRSPGVIVNEWELAHRTATFHPNIDHVAVPGDRTPLQAVVGSLARFGQPEIGSANAFWNLAMFEDARQRHCGVLLTGQMGNLGVSWPGPATGGWDALRRLQIGRAWQFVDGWRRRHRHSWPRAAWHTLAKPARAQRAAARLRRQGAPFEPGPLIDPGFAARLDLARRAREEGWVTRLAAGTPREQRFGVFEPGISPAGAIWQQLCADDQLDPRDPTADVRLLNFCWRAPDDLFARPEAERWLMRRAMEGLLPADVQWNARRGRQSADLAYRLRADAAAMSAAVDTVAASPRCRAYMQVEQLRAWWRTVADPGGPDPSEPAFRLLSALTVGLFLADADA